MVEEAGDAYERYEEYELYPEERESVREIKKCHAEGYASEQTLRAHLNYLEALCSKLRMILKNEEGAGYSNETLKHDYKRVRELCSALEKELGRFD